MPSPSSTDPLALSEPEQVVWIRTRRSAASLQPLLSAADWSVRRRVYQNARGAVLEAIMGRALYDGDAFDALLRNSALTQEQMDAFASEALTSGRDPFITLDRLRNRGWRMSDALRLRIRDRVENTNITVAFARLLYLAPRLEKADLMALARFVHVPDVQQFLAAQEAADEAVLLLVAAALTQGNQEGARAVLEHPETRRSSAVLRKVRHFLGREAYTALLSDVVPAWEAQGIGLAFAELLEVGALQALRVVEGLPEEKLTHISQAQLRYLLGYSDAEVRLRAIALSGRIPRDDSWRKAAEEEPRRLRSEAARARGDR